MTSGELFRSAFGVAVVLCALPLPAFAAADKLTIGDIGARPGSIAHVPVYIRDVSGTMLNAGGSARIQAIAFRAIFTHPELVAGCSTTTFPDCQISFTPAGVLAGLQPSQESISTGASSISVRYVYDRTSQPIGFTLDQAAPGDLIGTIDVEIVASASLGTELAFTVDTSPNTTALSDSTVPFGEGVSESINRGLELGGGTLTLSRCTVAPASSNFVITADGCSSGSCQQGKPVVFRLTASNYELQSCDSISWAFGDGESDSGQSVTHVFTKDGPFTVTATITNPSGSASVSQQITIPPPSACPALTFLNVGISTNPNCATTTCATSTEISFTVNAFSGYSFNCGTHAFEWNFGDNGPVATSRTTTHQYSSGGTFPVTVKVTSPSSTITLPTIVKIGGGTSGGNCSTPPSSSNIFITWSGGGCKAPNSVCAAGTPIEFAPAFFGYDSGCSLYTISWTFGDGSSSTNSNATHLFATPGFYNVTMKFTSVAGVVVTLNRMFSIVTLDRRRSVKK